MKQQKRVAVGMSGGVDSSVAAALLVEQGYEVTGVFIEAYNEPGCRTDEDRKDALAVATQLDLRFKILDLRKEYKEKVVKYFFEEYKAGRTPNPDVVCNREVKFGLFYDYAIKAGFDYVATGHYARIAGITNNQNPIIKRLYLQRASDQGKDQSYFLWQVEPERLGKILFPLGEMRKKEVRQKAKELGLPNAAKPDSMGVCMMGELNVREFLREKLGEQEGEVVLKITNNQAPITKQNKQNDQRIKVKKFDYWNLDVDYLETNYVVVGQHKGLWFHTIGERVGQDVRFKIDDLRKAGIDTTNMPALYVVGKDPAHNMLVVGTRNFAETQNFCITYQESRITHEQMEELVRERKLFVRVRNLGELYQVGGIEKCDTSYVIHATELIFGVAEGQSAVFYARLAGRGDEVVAGGGIISV